MPSCWQRLFSFYFTSTVFITSPVLQRAHSLIRTMQFLFSHYIPHLHTYHILLCIFYACNHSSGGCTWFRTLLKVKHQLRSFCTDFLCVKEITSKLLDYRALNGLKSHCSDVMNCPHLPDHLGQVCFLSPGPTLNREVVLSFSEPHIWKKVWRRRNLRSLTSFK